MCETPKPALGPKRVDKEAYFQDPHVPYIDPAPKSADLTPRQRAIVRAYFAAGCRTKRAAQALGLHPTRVQDVKSRPAARVYLAELEDMAAHAITQARAAQILAPMLK